MILRPAILKILRRCLDQRDWESPVRVGKYLAPLSYQPLLRSQIEDNSKAVITEKSTLPQHPAKVNSVTLWSVLDGLAARGAYRGWYTGRVQTIHRRHIEATIRRALYGLLTFTPHAPLPGILGQEDAKDRYCCRLPHPIHPILMVWLCSVYLAPTLPRSCCLRVGTAGNTTPQNFAAGPTIWSTMPDAKSDPKHDAAFDVKSEQLCTICRQLVCTTFGKTASAAKITDQSIVERRLCSAGEKLIEQPFEGNDRTDEKIAAARKERAGGRSRLWVWITFRSCCLLRLLPPAKPHLTLHCIALRCALHFTKYCSATLDPALNCTQQRNEVPSPHQGSTPVLVRPPAPPL